MAAIEGKYNKIGKDQLEDTQDDIEMYDVSSKRDHDTEITDDIASSRADNASKGTSNQIEDNASN